MRVILLSVFVLCSACGSPEETAPPTPCGFGDACVTPDGVAGVCKPVRVVVDAGVDVIEHACVAP